MGSVARSAAAIVDLIERDIRPRAIITDGAIRNAVRTMLAIGGSINTIKHLQAIAVESGLDIDVWETFRTMGRDTPLLARCAPTAHGSSRTSRMRAVAPPCCTSSCRSWTATSSRSTAGTIGENAAEALPADGTVIRPLDNPFGTDPAIAVLRGTLAPGGAVAKRPVPDPGPRRFTGPARIFANREEAIAGISNGRLRPGDVAVIRGIGVSGAPGMGLTSAFIFALHAQGLAQSVALVTDGQFSGLVNQGMTVGEVSPEAATAGAPLGLVQDDDIIDIDLESGTLDLLVDPAELAARPRYLPPEDRDSGGGMLDQYEQLVQPLQLWRGAVRPPRGSLPIGAAIAASTELLTERS